MFFFGIMTSTKNEDVARDEMLRQDSRERWTRLAQKWVEDIFIDRGMILLPREEALYRYGSALTSHITGVRMLDSPINFGPFDSMLMEFVDAHLASEHAGRGELVGFVEVSRGVSDAKALIISFCTCHTTDKRPGGEIAIPAIAIECKE